MGYCEPSGKNRVVLFVKGAESGSQTRWRIPIKGTFRKVILSGCVPGCVNNVRLGFYASMEIIPVFLWLVGGVPTN